MDNERLYSIEHAGQMYQIRIVQPKPKRQFRGYVTDVNNMELGSGRWLTVPEAEQALETIVRKIGAPAAPPAARPAK